MVINETDRKIVSFVLEKERSIQFITTNEILEYHFENENFENEHIYTACPSKKSTQMWRLIS